ncbi:MAG: DNA polymerase III subunit epsilon [Betaproteobacteria bacterium HGW-Betaproteobacteria-10]|jgi:DNA polymerase-3 subunit epsilon|nr:MAG: DNA polymerase III subunit epsilon [Betaproteobacteria bacterium HGW-Betaproteobacteria-10]
MISWQIFSHLFSLRWQRHWQARRLLGQPAAAPLLAYLESPLAEREADWDTVNYLALDLETSGVTPGLDDILSFGWVCLDGAEIRLGTARHHLVRPRRALREENVAIHRITDDCAAGGQSLRVVLADFLVALTGRVLIAHYSPTEVGFIDAACRACYGGAFLPPVIDTLELAKRSAPHHRPGSLRLPALRASHHLPRYPLHNALSDALAAAELFLAQAEAESAQRKCHLRQLQRN